MRHRWNTSEELQHVNAKETLEETLDDEESHQESSDDVVF